MNPNPNERTSQQDLQDSTSPDLTEVLIKDLPVSLVSMEDLVSRD
jgi:hypothetical protein